MILAGGIGSRLSEETQLKPKPMIEIGGMPILWHIMKHYSKYEINDFVICLGYKGYMIKEYFVNYLLHNSDVSIDIKNNKIDINQVNAEPWKITLIDTGKNTMTGGRLKRIQSLISDTFCLTYGDGISDIDISKLIKFHNKNKTIATLTAVQPPGRFGILGIKGNNVTSLSEKPPGDGNWINGGYYVLEPDIFDKIHDDSDVWETNSLQNLIQKNQVSVFRYNDVYQPMDTMNDKEKLQKLWNSNNAYWKIWK